MGGIFVVAHAEIRRDQVGEDGEMFGMSSARDRRPVISGTWGVISDRDHGCRSTMVLGFGILSTPSAI
jgi:hypothetical protein